MGQVTAPVNHHLDNPILVLVPTDETALTPRGGGQEQDQQTGLDGKKALAPSFRR